MFTTSLEVCMITYGLNTDDFEMEHNALRSIGEVPY